MGSADALRAQINDLVRRYYAEKLAPRPFGPSKDLVHFAGRTFDADEVCNLVDASLDFFLTANRFAERFETDFAEYLGLSDALLVNSGSSANLLALTALTSPKLGQRRLEPGDEVVTVAAGFPTTVAPIVQNNLVPVFVDVNLGDYTAIPEQLQDAIGPKTRAIMWEHAPMERLAGEGQLFAYRHESFWQCMDTVRDLRYLESLWESGRVPWKTW